MPSTLSESQKLDSEKENILAEQLSTNSIEIKSEGESEEENIEENILTMPETESIQDSDLELLEMKKPDSLMAELCNKTVLLRFLGSICLQISIYSVYGPSLYLNKDLGIDNVYLNGSLLALIGMVGYTLNYMFAHKMGHRGMNIMVNIIVFVCAITLLIMDLINNSMKPYEDRSNVFRVIETSKNSILI